MAVSRRKFLTLLGAGVALTLPSCQTPVELNILGYSTAPRHTACIRTVRVPLFENHTFVRGLEVELTEAVVKRINQVAPWRVVQSGNADAELLGSISALFKRPTLMNQLNEIREADLALIVEIDFHDLRTGSSLMRPQEELPPQPVPDPLLGGPLPVAAGRRPLMIQRTAHFVPELGASYATARSQVIKEMAVQIVNVLEDPW
ncbi:MAG TPA: LPS assembly lipoprotein LptE [Gemmatales bacterium]|nr:LPS assembly lipoprotein LptE [Gemmatales bacterium]HMP59521.1 LPS assembly lipoprotein LptE [Gemmatales bacterium]